MDKNRFSFSKGWYTAGHGELWDCDSTYCLVPYEELPPLNSQNFQGDFRWLIDSEDEYEDVLPLEDGERLAVNLDRLARLTEKANLKLPAPFVKLIADSHLRSRLDSCTGCYFDLSDRLIEHRQEDEGFLIRFLNDSQCVLVWYLFLSKKGENCIIAAHPEFFDEYEEETLDDMMKPTNLYYCAPDFETFIYRFWIENSIWFSLNEGRALNREQQEYFNQARLSSSN